MAIYSQVVVIGGSAGSVEVLVALARQLPRNFPAPLLVVVHVPSSGNSVLPEILSRAGALVAEHAKDGEPLQPGRIFVAPPNRHLIVEAKTLRLTFGPMENRSRPAIDPLFRSAAYEFGPAVIGVMLPGNLTDGTSGLYEIKRRGGVTVLMDQTETAYTSMLRSAMAHVKIDHIVGRAELGALLVDLTQQPPEGGKAVSASEPTSSGIIARDVKAQIAEERDQRLSVFVCPDCGGSMWQINAGTLTRFECHVGHTFSGEDLLDCLAENTEDLLWRMVRTLEDKVHLTLQLAHEARSRRDEALAFKLETEAELDEKYRQQIRRILEEVNLEDGE